MFYRIAILLACACGTPPSARDRAEPQPFVRYSLGSPERQWRDGRVVDRVPAGPYVYLRLQDPSGQLEWFVSLRATTPSDACVRALVIGRAERFQSRRLRREFSPLLFAAVRRAAKPASNPLHPETIP